MLAYGSAQFMLEVSKKKPCDSLSLQQNDGQQLTVTDILVIKSGHPFHPDHSRRVCNLHNPHASVGLGCRKRVEFGVCPVRPGSQATLL